MWTVKGDVRSVAFISCINYATLHAERAKNRLSTLEFRFHICPPLYEVLIDLLGVSSGTFAFFSLDKFILLFFLHARCRKRSGLIRRGRLPLLLWLIDLFSKAPFFYFVGEL